MHDEDARVRWEAARALGQIGGEAAIGTLATALDDEDPVVRRVAARALGQIDDISPLADSLISSRQGIPEPIIINTLQKLFKIYRTDTLARGLGPNMGGSFDVFLSHNSKDKSTVRQLVQALQDRGLRVWLDEEQLMPGRPWQEALEEIIQTTRTAAVLVGKDGLGPWEIPEMRACLSEFVSRRLPVIPVLLPDAPTKPELPLFLRAFTWVDLRGGLTDAGLDRLQWGITGRKPG